jgi:hypothetical protein
MNLPLCALKKLINLLWGEKISGFNIQIFELFFKYLNIQYYQIFELFLFLQIFKHSIHLFFQP